MGQYETQLFLNPRAQEFAEYGSEQREIINQEAFAAAKAEITSWPGYEPTPLIALDGLAAANGIGALWCKHEGFRFGIGSFKPTGPTYAMLGVLKGEVQKATGEQVVNTQDLVDGKYAEITREIVVAAATSGNHGRAMAWGARTFGCRAVLYMNDGVSKGREEAIAGYGGEVVRVEGAYQRAVEQLQRDAAEKGAAEAFAARLGQAVCIIGRRVGQTNRMYGSVTNVDVADSLSAQSFEVDRRKILLDEPIKQLGKYTVRIRVHRLVTTEVTVHVVKEGTENEPLVEEVDAPSAESGDASSTADPESTDE